MLWVVEVHARTIPDLGNGLTIQGQPQRVVVLEYSFLDAVVLAGVSPVGIADDQRSHRILPKIRQQLGAYQSVGLRGQPNLETIVSLKPDLIIADKSRHQAIYEELQQIAPTLLLLSYGAEYEQLLEDASTIGDALGRQESMSEALNHHQELMDGYANQLVSEQKLLFAVASDRTVTIHATRSFASGVMQRLGLNNAVPVNDQRAYIEIGFEQLVGMNPDWLLFGDYAAREGGGDILNRWQQHPLWSMLNAVKQQQVLQVDPITWSLNRGIFGAEHIAQDLVVALNK
jgi:iron complex transport system substrate-binding protein